MDASTAMENNTTEYESEKLILGNAAKRKFPFGNEEDLKEDAKRKQKKEKLNDKVNSLLLDLIQVSEKRFQVANVTAQHFFKMNESLQFDYDMLERILLSNGIDITKGQHNNIDKVRKILKQSFEYLVRVNNVEMFRLAAELESEISS